MEGRLLLVDDDPGVLDLLNEYFAGQGYDVEVATSGEVALSAVRAKRPDLVILDIRMPGIDGVEVLRRLRRLLKLAVELGDLPAAGRDAVAAALERVGGGAPAA